jgi:hypothetical protein
VELSVVTLPPILLTPIGLLTPEMEELFWSVAVTVWAPVVTRVTP